MRSIRTGVKMNAARTATAVGVLALLSGGAAWWSTPERAHGLRCPQCGAKLECVEVFARAPPRAA